MSAVAAPSFLGRAARSEIVRHGGVVFSALTLNNGLNFLFHASMTRLLGVTSYAALSSLLSLMFIVVIPAAIAVTVVAKIASELRAVHDLAKFWGLCKSVMIGASAIGCVVFLLGCALSGPVGHFLHVADRTSIVLCWATIAVTFVGPVLRGILQGAERFTAYGASFAIESFGKLVLACAFVALGLGLRGALLGALFGSAISFAYTAIVIFQYRVPRSRGVHVDMRRLPMVVAATSTAMICVSTLAFADVILVKHFFDAQTAGTYAALSLAGKIMFFVVGFAPTVLLPKASARARVGLSATRLLIQAGGLAAAISLALLLVLGLDASVVVRLIAGAAYMGAAGYVMKYSLAMAFLAGANLVLNYKIALHRNDFILPALLVTAAEIAGMITWHASLGQLVSVILCGHALLFAVSLYRVTQPAPRRTLV